MDYHQKIRLKVIRIRHALRMRMDGAADGGNTKKTDPNTGEDRWVTIKGTHVLIDKEGTPQGEVGKKIRATLKKSKNKNAPAGPVSAFSKKCDELRKKNMASPEKSADWTAKKNDAEFHIRQTEELLKKAQEDLKDIEGVMEEYGCGGKDLDGIDKYYDELDKEIDSLYDKLDTLDYGSEEYDRLNGEIDKKNEDFAKIDEARMMYPNLEKAQKRVNDITGELDKSQRELERLKKEDPGMLRGEDAKEYEEAAEQRNKEVLDTFKSVSDCKTSQDVTDYLRAKGYFRKDGESAYAADMRTDLTKMKPVYAKACAGQIESIMEDYPWFKGYMEGVDCHDFLNDDGKVPGVKKEDLANAYGYADGRHFSFAEGFFGEADAVQEEFRHDPEKTYREDMDHGYHPKGTDYRAAVDHEMTHIMEKAIEENAKKKGMELYGGSIANTVMKRVQEKLYGEYDPEKEAKVRFEVSKYAFSNKWVQGKTAVDPQMRNSEWLAEAMSDARCSTSPGKVSLAVKETLEELMKEVGLQ